MKKQNSIRSENYDQQSRVFALVINNPEEHGYDREKIILIIHDKFPHVIYWCMCEEIGNGTGTHHIHIYILLKKKKRWSAVKNAFDGAHIEIAKGTPEQNVEYVKKEGKWADTDKAETSIPDTFYEEGTLPRYPPGDSRSELLENAAHMIGEGWRPEQIFNQSILYRQIEPIIRKHFFAKRFNETLPLRDVTVVYHLGASGSGKSYSYKLLCEKYGADDVFYASDFANNCTALLDNYEAQRILFIDEVKTDSFRYGYLLQLLQGYRTPVHARYANVYSLWQEVHITSIFTPHELFEGMVDSAKRSVDSEYQLLRRISTYVYHWHDENGFHEYETSAGDLLGKERTLLKEMKLRAEGIADGEDNENPFT